MYAEYIHTYNHERQDYIHLRWKKQMRCPTKVKCAMINNEISKRESKMRGKSIIRFQDGERIPMLTVVRLIRRFDFCNISSRTSSFWPHFIPCLFGRVLHVVRRRLVLLRHELLRLFLTILRLLLHLDQITAGTAPGAKAILHHGTFEIVLGSDVASLHHLRDQVEAKASCHGISQTLHMNIQPGTCKICLLYRRRDHLPTRLPANSL